MTNPSPLHRFRPTPVRAATLALAVTAGLGLGGCTTVGHLFGGKADYRAGAQRTQPLEVPPDLTQLQRDSRYLPQGGVVSASELGKPGAPVAEASDKPVVAPDAVGDMKVEHVGDRLVLESARAPDVLWPAVRQFWLDQGFKIADENPTAGYIETDWAENRVKVPQDALQKALSQVAPGLVDSGFRDRYRVRLERMPDGGTEIHVAQFGLKEEVTGWQKDGTAWVPRPNDPGLEAEMLRRMMVALGAGDSGARAAVAAASASAPGAASAPAAADHARVLAGQPGATLEIDDGFDRAWRRVGLTLDHGSFTVEDRDRAQGLYFVRFADAKEAEQDEPGFFSKIGHWFTGKPIESPVSRYRIHVQANAAGDKSTATILDHQGNPDNSAVAQRIVQMLLQDLR